MAIFVCNNNNNNITILINNNNNNLVPNLTNNFTRPGWNIVWQDVLGKPYYFAGETKDLKM